MEKKIAQTLNSRIRTANFSFSIDERINEKNNSAIIDAFGSPTRFTTLFLHSKTGIKGRPGDEEWEMENFVKETILEKLGYDKRTNLTKEAELFACEKIIQIYSEKLKNPNLNEGQIESFKKWIEDAEKIKEERK